MARPPAAPPLISGFTYLKTLGSGGFADVYLYEQAMPRRRVAVKVLLAGLQSDRERRAFEAEANLMAQLSTHPSIVTIYEADISADGRPYLAMEYCGRPSLDARFRRERISVDEALRIGIHVAGAVETAHRAGILHRDIKPANILVTDYNNPALTDFGIAGTLFGDDVDEFQGMSVPWSPPEVFGAIVPAGTAIDIYGLGATVYSLLAGRSPFELRGASNGSLELMSRIQSAAVTPTGRPDVPPSLETALARCMAKQPALRFATALDFARALQKVQMELNIAVTMADVLEESRDVAQGGLDVDDAHTRIRGIVSISPTVEPTRPPRSQPITPMPPGPVRHTPQPGTPGIDETQRRGVDSTQAGDSRYTVDHTVMRGSESYRRPDLPVPPISTTVVREPQSSEAPRPGEPLGAQRNRRFAIAAFVVLVVVIGGGSLIAVVSGQPSSATAPRPSAPVDAPADPGANASVPEVTDLRGSVDPSGVVFSWSNPEPLKGDQYLWGVVVPGVVTAFAPTDSTSVTVPADPTGRTCLNVILTRANARSAAGTTVCAP